MSLQAVYKQFLAAPNSALLASDASLNYITTLVTVNGSAEIIKHLNNETRELKKKEEKYLGVVEGGDALAVEVSTTIEFLIGGGAYLPKLDDNFLADRVVTFPIIHIVSFDTNGKIQQIRQSWDQGSLLKLIDVIGKTGRNWPIRDGKDQIKLIANSVKSTGKSLVDAPPAEEESAYNRSRGNSTHVTRDPHASLSLFAPRSTTIEEPLPSVVAPKSSAKPPPRDYDELFGGQHGNVEPLEERSESPSRPIAARIGSGKNYGPSRLFDTESAEETMADRNKEKMYRPNAARYQHFDFGDGEEAEQKKPAAADTSKHGSQWNFDDFMTPQKAVPSKVLRTNDVRHWGNSDDEVVDSPVKVKKVDKPRKDAETHFEFVDDGTPEGGRRIPSRPRGQGQNTGAGLYKDNLFDQETGAAAVGNEPGHNLANIKERSKNFDPHFTMTDDSPASKPAPQAVPENKAKVLKNMDANWDTYDQSPSQKENGTIVNKGINVAGDGMGGKKGPLSEATNIMSHRNDNPRGINTAGDGMGGKKGSGRSWGFGDDSGGEDAGAANKPTKFRTGKTQGKAQATGGDFWDF